MKYGIYKATLSIGFAGAEWNDEWDVTRDYSQKEWEDLGEEGQDLTIRGWMDDALGQHIEMSYREKE